MQAEVALCSVVLFFSAILCSAAGIGGGGVYVAVLMVMGGLQPHSAIPLSKAVVFFGSIASLLLNMLRARSSTGPARQVIDFNACRIVVPAALMGTFLGVLMNWHMKGFTLVFILTGLLVFMTCMVSHTAWKQYKEEMGLAVSAAAERAPLLGAAAVALPSWFVASGKELQGTVSSTDIALSAFMLVAICCAGTLRHHVTACGKEWQGSGVKGSCEHPVLAMLAPSFGSVMESESSVAMCLRLIAFIPNMFCATIGISYGFIVHHSCGWLVGRVALYEITAALTGLLAGLVGVGGGLILSPFFILTGMEPSVAVATSSTCVLFTSSSTTIQYMFTDRIHMALAVVYGVVCLLASLLGTSLVHRLQDRCSGQRSYITLLVVAGVALSTILSLGKLVNLMTSEEHGSGAVAA